MALIISNNPRPPVNVVLEPSKKMLDILLFRSLNLACSPSPFVNRPIGVKYFSLSLVTSRIFFVIF